jgi:hypothetical protein
LPLGVETPGVLIACTHMPRTARCASSLPSRPAGVGSCRVEPGILGDCGQSGFDWEMPLELSEPTAGMAARTSAGAVQGA